MPKSEKKERIYLVIHTCSSNLEYLSVSCLNISHGGILALASFAA